MSFRHTYQRIGTCLYFSALVLATNALVSRQNVIEPIEVATSEDEVQQLTNTHHPQQLHTAS